VDFDTLIEWDELTKLPQVRVSGWPRSAIRTIVTPHFHYTYAWVVTFAAFTTIRRWGATTGLEELVNGRTVLVRDADFIEVDCASA
jgi:hypothetical protein